MEALTNFRNCFGQLIELTSFRKRIVQLICLMLVAAGSGFGVQVFAQENPTGPTNSADKVDPSGNDQDGVPSAPKKAREAFLIQVPLPITGQADQQVRRQIDRILPRFERVSENRPILVLEFDTSKGGTGAGSQFGSCLDMSKYLTRPEMDRVRTVAYIPSFTVQRNTQEEKPKSKLQGHAVLVALSCDELVMHEDSTIGSAGIDETTVDDLHRAAYQTVVARRAFFPKLLALSMIDKDLEVHKVETDNGVDYVDGQRLIELETSLEARDSKIISDVGTMAELDSATLKELRLVERVKGRTDLAKRFGIDPNSIQGDPSLMGDWNAIQIKVDGYIERRMINWIIRALDTESAKSQPNLIIVEINSSKGESQQAMRLAQRLADFDSAKVTTVAYVPTEAIGVASTIALSCDHLIMGPDATLGGPNTPELDEQKLDDLNVALRRLAELKDRDYSPYLALLDQRVVLKQYKNRTTVLPPRLLTQTELEEMEDSEDWAELREINTLEGISADTALELGLAKHIVSDFETLKTTIFQIEGDLNLLQPTAADKWIENFSRQLSRPMVAGWLLFAAMFFLSAELSNPGVGIPGLLSAICVTLFFWSQYCDGNAEWLEILLFGVGVILIAVEIFALPGFGVFGIGGLILVLVSIVLATQTFVFPRNSEEFHQLPTSLGIASAGFMGVFAAVLFIQKFLPHTPFLNRMVLKPPVDDELNSISKREAMVDFDYLVGEKGITTSMLRPSGKAQIGNELLNVISDGRVIEKGQPIRVKQVDGSRIEVWPV